MNEFKMLDLQTTVAKVAYTIDEYSFVINKGSKDNIDVKKEYFIVELGELIVDPDTGKPLERLHLVKGTARIESIQESIAILKSSERVIIKHAVKKKRERDKISSFPAAFESFLGYEVVEPAITEPKKITNLKVGDLIIPKE